MMWRTVRSQQLPANCTECSHLSSPSSSLLHPPSLPHQEKREGTVHYRNISGEGIILYYNLILIQKNQRRVKLQSLQFYINSKTINLHHVKSVIISAEMVHSAVSLLISFTLTAGFGVSLTKTVQSLPQRARLSYGKRNSHVEEQLHSKRHRTRKTKAPLTFRFHLRRRTVTVLLHLPCAPARLSRPLGSSGELLRDPIVLGILFESSAHCPDRRHLFLCLLFFQRPKRHGLVFLQVSYT